VSDPLVSVVVATRNRRAWLAETAASVRAQSGARFELIVVDDASTDDTWSWLEREAASGALRALRLPEHGERSAARNLGLAEARGELVMFLDDDDLLLPGALAHLARALGERPGAVAAVGARWDWSFEGNGKGRRDSHVWIPRLRPVFSELLFGWSAVSGQILFRTARVREIGGYTSTYIPTEDRHLWLRLSRLGPVVLIPRTVLKYRVHGGQWRPENIQWIRERVYRGAIRSLPRREWRRGLRIRQSSRLIRGAEVALAEGRTLAGLGQAARAFAMAPGLFVSPLIGSWVARRLLRPVWHRLRRGQATISR
jgi:glycosyltransferase involved in cell wall biosynthesis